MNEQTSQPRSLPPSLVPGLRPDTTLGEIAQKIGRKLAQEQDTVMHKFAEAHPEVIIDDIALCHGHVKGADHSVSYRIWVEIRTPEEKAQRDLHRHYQLVEPELLAVAKYMAEILVSFRCSYRPDDSVQNLENMKSLEPLVCEALKRFSALKPGDQAMTAAASGNPAPRSG